MAIYEAPKDNSYTPSRNFGDTLHSGLQELANAKLGQIKQQHQATQNAKALLALGYTPQEAQYASHVPLETILKYREPSQQGQQQESNPLQQMQAQQQQQKPQQVHLIGPKRGQPFVSQMPQQAQQQVQQQPAQTNIQQQPLKRSLSKAEAQAQRDLAKEERAQRFALAKEEFKSQKAIEKEERVREHNLEKHEMAGYEKALKDKDTARETKKVVDRSIKLVQKGDIASPSEDHLYRWAAKTFMLPTQDLRGADTAELEKLTAGFIKNAKEWFGGRVTNYDLESFMKTLPSLKMDHESKLRLLSSMRSVAEAQELRANAYEQIRKENGGRLPPYAAAEVDKMIAPQLDKLAEEFVAGTNVPPLSEAAKKGEQRGWWLRNAKGVVTNLNPFKIINNIAGGIESAMPALETVGKAASAFL
jgi:hypothetical protein